MGGGNAGISGGHPDHLGTRRYEKKGESSDTFHETKMKHLRLRGFPMVSAADAYMLTCLIGLHCSATDAAVNH